MQPTELDHNNIRVVGFDLDQTLYPKSPEIDEAIQAHIFGCIAEYFGVPVEEAAERFQQHYQQGSGVGGTRAVELLGVPGAHEIVQTALEKANIAGILSPDQTVSDFLEGLRGKGKSVDLITGSNRQQTSAKLASLCIEAATFSHIITADESSKSTGEAYKLWLSFYPGYTPDKFLYVGDRAKLDYEIPHALGIRTALVYVSEYRDEFACLQLATFHELIELLDV